MVVDLPEAPGSAHRPAPLVLPLTTGRPAWHLPETPAAAAGLATLLAVLDLAPPGPLLALVGNAPEHALLAAVYSTRLVRAVAGDGLVAHAARQAAATNALPLVVEERDLRPGGTSLDDYAGATALEPAVLHLAAGSDATAVLAGASQVLARDRPWVVVTADRGEAAPGGPGLHEVVADAGSPGVYVLAPGTPGPALRDRIAAWSHTLVGLGTAPEGTGRGPVLPQADRGVVDLRDGLTARR